MGTSRSSGAHRRSTDSPFDLRARRGVRLGCGQSDRIVRNGEPAARANPVGVRADGSGGRWVTAEVPLRTARAVHPVTMRPWVRVRWASQAGFHSAGTPQPSPCSATRRISGTGGGGFSAWGVLRPRWSRIAGTHERVDLVDLGDQPCPARRPYMDEGAAENLFRHKVLALLRRKGRLSQERIDLLNSWRRSGFSVHNRGLRASSRWARVRGARPLHDATPGGPSRLHYPRLARGRLRAHRRDTTTSKRPKARGSGRGPPTGPD